MSEERFWDFVTVPCERSRGSLRVTRITRDAYLVPGIRYVTCAAYVVHVSRGTPMFRDDSVTCDEKLIR